uniref:Uncharacterized protein n=1 Tax=Amphimedon queenslandica TaxID=400682 RepID=A0A1X7TVM7_AMPQE
MKLKEEPIATIGTILKGRDVFLWLPTGFRNPLVIVLSPLLALMVNQVTNLSSTIQAIEDDLAYAIPKAILKQRWKDVIEMPEVAEGIVAFVVLKYFVFQNGEYMLNMHALMLMLIIILFYLYNRSKDFRTTYGKIHEIRALVRQHVPLMACAAMATKSVRDKVLSLLDMKGCEVNSTCPDRPNIFNAVNPRTEIELDLSSLINSLRIDKNNAAPVIVHCPSLNMCSDRYATFHYELG